MAATTTIGIVGKGGNSWMQMRGKERKQKRVKIFCSYSSSFSLMDSYNTLGIQPGASQAEVKKAFRHLALQYHPDVCRGSKCGVQFHQINEAYNIVMANLRGESNATEEVYETYEYGAGGNDEPMEEEVNGTDWDMWEEWMGWEGAGIRDYSSHINPYI